MNTTTTNYAFTNKAEYLIARAAWRNDYAILSQDIREWKKELKEHQRKGTATCNFFYSVLSGKTEATEMLERRKAMKIQAQEQYLAEKARQATPVSA